MQCRDGGNADGSGYVGARVYGNIISSALGGAVFIHGGGNVNFSNNIVVDTSVPGEFWGAVSIAAVNNASVEKRPGSHFDRNIFVVVLPPGIKQSADDEEKQGLGRGRKEDYPEEPDPFEGG